MYVGREVEVTETLAPGFYRLSFHVPKWLGVPKVSLGKKFSVPLTDYVVELKRYDWTEATGILIVEVEVYTLRFMTPDSYNEVVNVAPDALKNPWLPVVRNSGGYVKGEIQTGSTLESPQAVPQILVGAIVAIIGLGVLYLALDKIETLVDKPQVSIFMIAIVAIAGIVLFRQLKAV